jgi:hypothetical protein
LTNATRSTNCGNLSKNESIENICTSCFPSQRRRRHNEGQDSTRISRKAVQQMMQSRWRVHTLTRTSAASHAYARTQAARVCKSSTHNTAAAEGQVEPLRSFRLARSRAPPSQTAPRCPICPAIGPASTNIS